MVQEELTLKLKKYPGDKKLRRIIMENLPQVEKGETTRIYLEIAVQQDLKSLGYEFCMQDFNRNLNQLH
ncbi:MAG: hypothetical protein VX670_10975, partial [Candidatus Latescibacterota bacterium]|nr:hypothetical protein [Candidatus Latescibacterota bacterium]